MKILIFYDRINKKVAFKKNKKRAKELKMKAKKAQEIVQAFLNSPKKGNNYSIDAEVFEKTGATAALAASLFHFKELTVQEVKECCRNNGVIVR